jgi:CO/xanthine dehydrogenase Mo-binding subunit
MLHGRVVRPPSRGAHLLSVGAAAGTQVVRIGSFVAVVAESEAAAIQGARSVSVDWAPAPQILSMNELYDHIKGLPTSDVVITNRGDVSKAIAGTERRIEAEYRQPFQAHASIGPSCAVAMEQNGVMTVWCSSQGVYPLRAALADLLGVAAEKVHVVRAEGSGCYGHNGADDVAADAVLLARETGRPVRVQWSRGDEFAWEPNGPAMIMRLEGGVDSSGRICAWRNEVRTPSHTSRPRVGIDLIAGQLIAEKLPPPKKTFMGGDRNAPTNYKIENQQITMRWISRLPLRVSALRSLGAFANSFANESFIDELAVMVGADPVEFRLLHLQDPRSREVLTTAAKSAGWGRSLPVGEGLGVAFARYENNEAYVATVAHLRVDSESGKIQLLKIVIAHDCGLIINPDGLKNQIEGNVIQSASRALLERTTWQDSRITSRDWLSYPILRFSDVPEIEIHLINRPAEPAFGAGEPATITTAPAIANALFSASGARLREIPFLPQTVKRAMSGGSGR